MKRNFLDAFTVVAVVADARARRARRATRRDSTRSDRPVRAAPPSRRGGVISESRTVESSTRIARVSPVASMKNRVVVITSCRAKR